MTVKHFNNEGDVIYLKELIAPLDKKRQTIPKRNEVLWSGKLTTYSENEKHVEKLTDAIQ